MGVSRPAIVTPAVVDRGFFPGVARKAKAGVKGACSEIERRRTGKEQSEDKCEGHQSTKPFLPHCGLHLRLLDCR